MVQVPVPSEEPKEERSSLLNDSVELPMNADLKFELVVPDSKPALDLSQSHFEEKPSLEDLERVAYLEKLDTIKDSVLASNLRHFMDIGYLNFELNLNLLKRHNNDLILAMNSLCNGQVTDSMF
jgi:hypothetical protein